MAWFDDLKAAIPGYYPAGGLPNVVGYLRGAKDPGVWRNMEQVGNRNQMIILGSRPPGPQDWLAAGVAQRGSDQTITLTDLAGFIVLYGGFVRRPWGKIYVLDAEALQHFPAQLASWRSNYKPPAP
ncbi:MAG TPA: hypothetical protein VFE12_17645 [Acetobacteraceae bacterium]|jgi:hypothetical protein|nr:hypothetical protein [Acetobacteraceae bacterium]